MTTLARGSLPLVGLFAVGALAAFGYASLTGVHSEGGTAPSHAPVRALVPSSPQSSTQSEPEQQLASATLSTEPSIQEASPPSNPAGAIADLGSASKAEAIPALENVIRNGDATDQAQALAALRTLAQTHGDADEKIRSLVRKIAYHGSDESLTLAAQTTLDQIESDLTQAN